jgi:Ras-related protein Rab-1A
MASKDLSFKVLVIGDSGVGKTSLFLRFMDDTFSDETMPTMGGEAVKTRQLQVDDQNVVIVLRDTDGQERFGNITCSLYQGMAGIIVTYDVGNATSFESVKNWIAEMERYAKDDANVMLVGNKTDLEQKAVSTEQGEELANNKNYPFIETSAKTGDNVEELFTKLAQEMLARYRAKAEAKALAQSTLDLSPPSPPRKKKPCSLF